MPFISDALKVLGAFLHALGAYAVRLGFETMEFVVMRNEHREIRAVAGGEPFPFERKTYPRVKFTLPGWSELTRLPHRFERSARFTWL